MSICLLLHQQGDGCAHVNHREAFSGLAPRLITPRGLPGSNTDRDMQMMSWLLLGFGQLRPWLGHLELARRHMYLLYDEGIRRSKQGAWWVGLLGIWRGRWWYDDQCMVITRKILSSTFLAMDTTALWAAIGQHIVHQLLFILHCLPSTLAC